MASEPFGSMGPGQYLEERVKQYQAWYDSKAVKLKSRYLYMRAATVVGGAIVPVLVSLDIPSMKYVTASVSLLVVVLVSLESVYHYREQWKNYRSTEQFLGSERILFLTKEGRYKGVSVDAAFLLLVERVEAAIASENAATLNIMTLSAEARESKEG
jgi:hypothetical protein